MIWVIWPGTLSSSTWLGLMLARLGSWVCTRVSVTLSARQAVTSRVSSTWHQVMSSCYHWPWSPHLCLSAAKLQRVHTGAETGSGQDGLILVFLKTKGIINHCVEENCVLLNNSSELNRIVWKRQRIKKDSSEDILWTTLSHFFRPTKCNKCLRFIRFHNAWRDGFILFLSN